MAVLVVVFAPPDPRRVDSVSLPGRAQDPAAGAEARLREAPDGPATGASRRRGAGAPSEAPPASAESRAGHAEVQLRVTCVDAVTAVPLAGFGLDVGFAGNVWQLRTDAEGRVALDLERPRGVVDFAHRPDGGGEAFDEPWELERDSVLLDLESGRTQRVTLAARAPLARVDVVVLRADGSAAVGARIQLVQGREVQGAVRWHRWRFATTDGTGRARLLLHRTADLDSLYRLALREPLDGEVSAVHDVDPRLAGPHRLRLVRGSQLEVEVVDGEGLGLEGFRVDLLADEPTRRLPPDPRTSDARGPVTFGPLAAGDYHALVRPSGRRAVIASGSVRVEQEVDARLAIAVPAAALAPQLHVAGRVLDPAGKPVEGRMLLVALDGEAPRRVFTEADGSFAYASAASAREVTVHAMASVYDRAVRPERLRVPAGTEGLELREVGADATRTVIFEVLDGATRAPLPDEDEVAIHVYLDGGARERVVASAAFGPDDGTCEVDFVPHPGMAWVVSAPGYREERGVFGAAPRDDTLPIVRVALEPGFRRGLTVLDSTTAAPLAGVTVWTDDRRRLATSGFDGGLVIESDRWPEWLTFEHAGYEPLRWPAARHWVNHSDRVWLAPAAVDGR